MHSCRTASLRGHAQARGGVPSLLGTPRGGGGQRWGVPQTCSALQCCCGRYHGSLSLYRPVAVVKYCKNKSRPSKPCSGPRPGAPGISGACLGKRGVAAAGAKLAAKSPIPGHGESCAAPGTGLFLASLGYFRENVVRCSPALAKCTAGISCWVAKLAQRGSRSLRQPARKESVEVPGSKPHGE